MTAPSSLGGAGGSEGAQDAREWGGTRGLVLVDRWQLGSSLLSNTNGIVSRLMREEEHVDPVGDVVA